MKSIRFGATIAATLCGATLATPCHAQQLGGARPEMVTEATQRSIERGLRYLASNQRSDGSWGSNGRYGGYPTAMTSLAGLALLAGGHTPVEGEYASNVRRAVEFLIRRAAIPSNNGLIAHRAEGHSVMHGHGFAMLFLAEAYGMEQDRKRQQEIRRVLERAIKLTGESQSRAGGWLYQPNSNSDEGSVTVTQIQGLRACRNAGIKVPPSIISKACDYIKKSQNADGGISYRVGMSGSRPAITSAAVAVMYSAGRYEHTVAQKALEYVVRMHKNNPSGLSGGHRFYSHLYTAQAMYLSDKKNWKAYFPGVRDQLVRSQSANGSWQGDHVGSVYGASIACIVLQLPYANLPIFQR